MESWVCQDGGGECQPAGSDCIRASAPGSHGWQQLCGSHYISLGGDCWQRPSLPLPLKSWSVSDPLRCSSRSFLCWSLLPYSSWFQPCVAFWTFFARGGPVILNSPVSPHSGSHFPLPFPHPATSSWVVLKCQVTSTETITIHLDFPLVLLAPGHSPPAWKEWQDNFFWIHWITWRNTMLEYQTYSVFFLFQHPAITHPSMSSVFSQHHTTNLSKEQFKKHDFTWILIFSSWPVLPQVEAFPVSPCISRVWVSSGHRGCDFSIMMMLPY